MLLFFCSSLVTSLQILANSVPQDRYQCKTIQGNQETCIVPSNRKHFPSFTTTAFQLTTLWLPERRSLQQVPLKTPASDFEMHLEGNAEPAESGAHRCAGLPPVPSRAESGRQHHSVPLPRNDKHYLVVYRLPDSTEGNVEQLDQQLRLLS